MKDKFLNSDCEEGIAIAFKTPNGAITRHTFCENATVKVSRCKCTNIYLLYFIALNFSSDRPCTNIWLAME